MGTKKEHQATNLQNGGYNKLIRTICKLMGNLVWNKDTYIEKQSVFYSSFEILRILF